MACSSGAEKDSDLFFCLFEKCLYKCLFDMRRDEPDDELLIIESRHGPVETVFHKEVGTMSRGREDVFIVLTRFVSSCIVMGGNLSRARHWRGKGGNNCTYVVYLSNKGGKFVGLIN